MDLSHYIQDFGQSRGERIQSLHRHVVFLEDQLERAQADLNAARASANRDLASGIIDDLPVGSPNRPPDSPATPIPAPASISQEEPSEPPLPAILASGADVPPTLDEFTSE